METEVSLKRFLKKDRFIVELIYTGKSISSYFRQFQLTLFLR